jgi:hypothetical protein
LEIYNLTMNAHGDRTGSRPKSGANPRFVRDLRPGTDGTVFANGHRRRKAAMMMQTESVTHRHKVRALRTAIVVGRDPDERVLDMIAEAGNYDVVVIAPAASAYSQIKRSSPDMIVACVAFDDPAAFQLMSMLTLDRDTARIPMITCLAEPVAPHPDV